MISYEGVLDTLTSIPFGNEGWDRRIQWLTPSEVVGAARDHLGRVELFFAGPELHLTTSTLRSAIQHHSWHRDTGVPLDASRLLLPAYGHFDQIAALIATELIRERADLDLQRAFSVNEPMLELVIQRQSISEAALLGLAGELLLLDAISRRIQDAYVGRLIASWKGWRRSARDLYWENTGVEVKTTTRPTSSHIVQGTHQVEPTQSDDSTPGEDCLLLVSTGLQLSAPSQNSFTIPQLTQRITDRLRTSGNEGHLNDFLSHIAEYGAEAGLSYHHPEMSNDAPYTTTFTPTFVRAYDMSDPEVQVIRRDDVVDFKHVDATSLSFRIDLPASVSFGNPVEGLYRIADLILGRKF